MKKHFYLLITIATLLFLTACSTQPSKLTSPDGNLSLSFDMVNGKPAYSVTAFDKMLIDTSFLGFEFRDMPPMNKDFSITDVKLVSSSEIWKPLWGERSSVHNNYNELLVELEETTELNRKLVIRFRLFDDGLGFRYEFPEQDNINEFVIMNELTEFKLTGDHTCWWIPGDHDSYEYPYYNTSLSQIDVSKTNYQARWDRFASNMNAVNTPITMETSDGLYLSFHEANLTDYAGMTLALKDDLTLEADLVPWADGTKVKASAPFVTPWRTVIVTKNPGDLVKSDLILNLNEHCVLPDVSWIEPMKYVGIWWEMHISKSSWDREDVEGSWSGSGKAKHGATTENAKKYIDFAAANGIKGLLIEGWNTGWEYWGVDTTGFFDFITPYPDFDIEEVVKYAKEHGVELVGHHETAGDVTNYEERLEDAFKFYNKLGIRAVKTGYAGQIRPKGERHHGQFMVRHYRRVVETAAKYHIMVDAHEPIKPTGIRRTYPNMMTREGVRGMEYNAWSEGNAPEHTTILPFTRGLAGPIDYTPGIFDIKFDNFKKKERVHTTVAKQLALYVVLYSPLAMAADLPENYENQPAFEFIREVPVTWDETLVNEASIGDYVTTTRRKGNNWFVGSITDENTREVEISLDFLSDGVTYNAKIFSDGKNADLEKNPTAVDITEQKVTNKSVIKASLIESGGVAIIIKPE